VLIVICFFDLCFVLGASLLACRRVQRHIVALEEDQELYDGLLLSMRRVRKPEPAPVVASSSPPEDPDAVPSAVVRVLKKSRFSK
jgi:hypothetical protein